jgi:hypothetical protein
MWIIETKGWEKEDVARKDKSAEEWCSNASKLTGVEWEYLKIEYIIYMNMTNQLTKFAGENYDSFLKTLIMHKTEKTAQARPRPCMGRPPSELFSSLYTNRLGLRFHLFSKRQHTGHFADYVDQLGSGRYHDFRVCL